MPFLWHTAKNMFVVSPRSRHTVNNASLPCAPDLGTRQSCLPPHLISCVVPTATHTTHTHSLTGRAATSTARHAATRLPRRPSIPLAGPAPGPATTTPAPLPPRHRRHCRRLRRCSRRAHRGGGKMTSK